MRPDSLPHLDIVGHDVYEAGVPHGAYDEFRRDAPVAWVNETAANGHHGRGFWSLTTHEHVVAVHKDWRTFSSEIDGTEIEELEPDALVARRTMLETDPPRHTALRRLVNPTFSKRSVETYAAHATSMRRSSSGGPTRSSTTPTPTTPSSSATVATPTRTGCCRSAVPSA